MKHNFGDQLVEEMLKLNFQKTDIVNHGYEIIQQLWYEFVIQNTEIISI